MDEYDHNTDASEIDSSPVEEWESIEAIKRPLWPKVIGIISIVWGSLGLTCGGIGLAFLPLSSKFISSAVGDDPIPYGMVPGATDYAIALLGLGLAILLVFAGITAVSRRPLTRPMHLVYALGSIPIAIWSYLNQLNKNELNIQWAKEFPNNEMANSIDPANNPGVAVGQTIGLVLLIVLGIGVPLFYLIWFGLIKTKPEQVTGGDEGVY